MDAFTQLPTCQGSTSATFNHPSLDGQTVPAVYAHHAKASPSHPLFVFAEDSGNVRTICYPEAHGAIRRAAATLSSHISAQCAARYEEIRSRGEPPVVGVLSVAGTVSCSSDFILLTHPRTDTISTWTTMLGAMHLGLTVFPISSRNSVAGVAHLASKTGILQLYVSPDSATQRLAQQAAEKLAGDGVNLEILPLPLFAELYDKNNKMWSANPESMSEDDPVLILHTSGRAPILS
jgi:acyl-CoA synthetase (AMP-forming)/AMP-acid ligase II